jgi:Protein of unknown function (DUF2442)
MVTQTEFDRANKRAREMYEENPRAVSAKYDHKLHQIVISLNNGLSVMFPPRNAQGLQRARPSDLDLIEISPSGLGIGFPKLNADVFIPSLLQGFLGSKNWMAASLGATGGRSKSDAKAVAARENGRLGGRPKHKRVAAAAGK